MVNRPMLPPKCSATEADGDLPIGQASCDVATAPLVARARRHIGGPLDLAAAPSAGFGIKSALAVLSFLNRLVVFLLPAKSGLADTATRPSEAGARDLTPSVWSGPWQSLGPVEQHLEHHSSLGAMV
jgi:hypothetical protein